MGEPQSVFKPVAMYEMEIYARAWPWPWNGEIIKVYFPVYWLSGLEVNRYGGSSLNDIRIKAPKIKYFGL